VFTLPLQLCWLLLMLATCTCLEQLLLLISNLVDFLQSQQILPTSPSTRLSNAEQLHHLVPMLSMLLLMPLAVLFPVLLVRDTPAALGQLVSSSPRRLLLDMSPAVTRTNAMPETSVSTIRATLARACAIMAAQLILSLSSGMLLFLYLLSLSGLLVFAGLTNNFTNSTSTAAPYCNTISFPGDIMDVFCNNVDITGVQAALTTYRGESSRTFTPLTLTGDAPSSTTAESTSDSPSSSPTTSATGGGSSNSGDGSNSGDNGSGNDSDNGNSNGGGSKSKSNTGAIVGGVVGGVGGLALIGLAAFFFLRRRKSAAGHEPVSQNAPPVVYQPPPQNGQNFYDPKFAAATGQQPYPPPNQQYGQQGFYPPQPSVSPDGQTVSPNGSNMDPRFSLVPSSTSPAPSGGYVAPVAGGFQPQENVIHEAPAQTSDNHRGNMHELA
jgi:MYXO-CTERM domain-containing protein